MFFLLDCDIFQEDDDTYHMDLEVPADAEVRENGETLPVHGVFLDINRMDLFMHPIMETFLQFKWLKVRNVFTAQLFLDLMLCIAFSLVCYTFAKLYDCKYVDETDEKVAEGGLCNHMNDHFSVAEQCYYFFDHSSFLKQSDTRTYFINRWYGCDDKSRIMKSNLFENGTELNIQCYKNNTLR